jgi:hypothetical protein
MEINGRDGQDEIGWMDEMDGRWEDGSMDDGGGMSGMDGMDEMDGWMGWMGDGRMGWTTTGE